MKNKKLKIISIIILIVVILLVWGTNDIVTSTYSVGNEKIPSEFDGYRIVQISDLHNKEFGKNQKRLIEKIKKENPDLIVITGDIVDRRKWGTKNMEKFLSEIKGTAPKNQKRLIEKIKKENPDLIVITGDIVDRRKWGTKNMEKFLSEIKGTAPIYYVSGNHEVWSFKYDIVKKILRKYDVNILDDEVKSIRKRKEENGKVGKTESIKKGSSEIKIAGIIDTGFEDREEYVPEILKNLKKKVRDDEFSILLSHRPEHIENYSDAGFDLVFSGHAHGGQIRLPFIGGIYAPHQGFMPKYTKGVINMKKTKMVVSRGLGNSIQMQDLI